MDIFQKVDADKTAQLKEQKKALFLSIAYILGEVISMAKLYCQIFDERGTERHKIANREMVISIYFGSRENSKLAQKIRVKANGMEKPDIQVEEVKKA